MNAAFARIDTPTQIFGGFWLLALVFGTATLGLGMLGQALAFVAVFGALCAVTALWTDPARRYGEAIAARTFLIAALAISVAFAVTTYDGMYFWRVVSHPIPLWAGLRRAAGDLALRIGLHRETLMNPLDCIVLPAALLAPLRLGRTAFGLGPFRTGAAKTAILWLGIGLAVPLVELAVHAWAPGPLGRRILVDVLQNGYSEEFLCRGVIMGVLATRLGASGANVVQALAFGALHAGTEFYDYHNWLVAMSHSMLTNATLGLAMGFLTLRTGNIAIPGAFHALLDAWIPR